MKAIASRARIAVVVAALVHAGCIGGRLLAPSSGVTRVDSIPQGAEVFVMGESVGVTPLEIEDRLIYPVSYPAARAALYGRVVLEHAGCERTSRPIDLAAANDGVVVELRCEANTD